jgi:hypothetical protein
LRCILIENSVEHKRLIFDPLALRNYGTRELLDWVILWRIKYSTVWLDRDTHNAEEVNKQALVVDDFNDGSDAFLRQLWRSRSQRAIPKKDGAIVGFYQLRGFSNGKWPNSNGDGNRGCAVSSSHDDAIKEEAENGESE